MSAQTQDKAHVSFQTDAEMRDELLRLARSADRSLSAEIRRAIQAYITERSNDEWGLDVGRMDDLDPDRTAA